MKHFSTDSGHEGGASTAARILSWLALAHLAIGCGVPKAECPDGRKAVPFEVLGDGVDDDCDGKIDETAGALESRVHCGEAHVPCVLRPGASDVICVDGACVPLTVDGKPDPEPPDGCLDAQDDDGNGILDDGPHCEVLIASVARPECQGEQPSKACPPAGFVMGGSEPPTNGLREDWPPHRVWFTYDFLIDRYEVSRGQLAVFLEREGRCTGEARQPECDVSPDEARLPAELVDWCTAYTYCQEAGKRLLTEAEWERVARGTRNRGPHPWSDMPTRWAPNDGSNIQPPSPIAPDSAECRGYAPAVLECVDGPVPVDRTGGWVVQGQTNFNTFRDEPPAFESAAILHMGGNVWEWTYDEFAHYCHLLPGETCEDPLANGVLLSPRIDPVIIESAASDQRVLRGGSYARPASSATSANRTPFSPGLKYGGHGFRCGRTFDPRHEGPGSSPWADATPYDRTRDVDELAMCELEKPAIFAPITSDAAVLTDLCIPEIRRRSAEVALVVELFGSSLTREPDRLAIELPGDEGLIRLGQSRLDDGERYWPAENPPVSAPADGCLLGACPAIEFEGDGDVLKLRVTPSDELWFEVRSLRSGDAPDPACADHLDGRGALVIVEAVLLSASPFQTMAQDFRLLVCENLPGVACVEPEADCRTACSGWPVDLELEFAPDPSREPAE